MTNSALNITNDDVVLKPISGLRGKRHSSLPKGDLYALVYLKENWHGEYAHPEVELCVAYETKIGNAVYDERTTLLTLKFQRNPSETAAHRAGSRGFLAGANRRNKWSGSYAMKIKSETQWGNSINRFQAAVGLIQRAMEAVSYDNNPTLCRSLSRHDDQLLTIIAGLQRIGVTIIIKNGRKAKRNMISEV